MAKKQQVEAYQEPPKIPSDRPVMMLLAVLFVVGMCVMAIGGLIYSEFFMIFISMMLICVLFGILTMLFFAKTNAWTELKSSLRGTPIILLFNRDKTIQRVSCIYKVDAVETAKHGVFILTPDSVYRDKKTNLSTTCAYSTYGATIHPSFPMMATQLKKGGVDDINQAIALNEKMKLEDGAGLGVKLNHLETIRFDDIIGWFRYHINPHYISALIERNTALNLKGVRQIPIGWISAMAVLFVAAAIAYVIIVSQSGGGAVASAPNIIPSLTG